MRDPHRLNRKELFDKMWEGDAEALTHELSNLLFNTISYYDYKEDFYHAFLIGLFFRYGYKIESNRENGEGRTDIVVKDRRNRRAAIFEVKHADGRKQLEAMADTAISQIEKKRYAETLAEGDLKVLCYGAAFYGKDCRFVLKKVEGKGIGSINEDV